MTRFKLLSIISAFTLLFSSGCSQTIDKIDVGKVTLATISSDLQDNHSNEDVPAENDNDDIENQEQKNSVNLICVGDNLIHDSIYLQAKNRTSDGSYDFSPVYEKVEKYISPADIAILNQETIVTDEYEPSTYPSFCSPGALGDYMVNIGFNVISMSNNHILDKGEKGLIATLDYWDKNHPEVVRYGAYRDKSDMDNIRIKEVNGITFAFLGYMEHTNGIPHNGDLGTELVYLNELDLIEEQIKKADQLADVVIVSPHFGIEVSNEVTQSQYDLSQKFADWGADIIIGTQPHTLQECNWVERSDGTKAFVYYCLGNFVSAMSNNLAMVGGIGSLTVEKDSETGKIEIINPKVIPIITQYEENYSNIRIIPYVEYSDDLAESHGCKNFGIDTIDYVLSEIPEEFLLIE